MTHTKSFLIFLLALIICEAKNLRSEPSTEAGEPSADLIGFVAGPIVFLLSFVLIWYNEKRQAMNAERINKINELLNSKLRSPNVVSEYMNESLVYEKSIHEEEGLIYLSGTVDVESAAIDTMSGLAVPQSLKLQRIVEVREFRNVGKEDEALLGWYTYNDELEGSKTGGNAETNWFLKSETFLSNHSKIKGYTLGQSQLNQLQTKTNFPITEEVAEAICKSTGRSEWIIFDDYLYFPNSEGDKESAGTLRLRYQYSHPKVLSVISSFSISDNNPILKPFRVDLFLNKGKKDTLCCEHHPACFTCNALGELLKPISEVDLVYEGSHTSHEMINNALLTNKTQTMILRILSIVLMIGGIYLFFIPITDLVGYIPIVGGFLRSTASSLVFVGAILVSIPFFLFTFSLAWIRYRPKTGLALLLSSILVAVIIIVIEEASNPQQN